MIIFLSHLDQLKMRWLHAFEEMKVCRTILNPRANFTPIKGWFSIPNLTSGAPFGFLVSFKPLPTPHSPRFSVFSRTGTVVDLYPNQSLIRDLCSINRNQGLIFIPLT